VALARPGPLIVSASGPVGGVALAPAPGGLRLCSPPRRVLSASPALRDPRRALAAAARSWAALTPADRDLWAQASTTQSTNRLGARSPLQPFALYAAAWATQANAQALAQPPAPIAPPFHQPIAPLLRERTEGITLGGFSRSLDPGETVTARVDLETTPSRHSLRRGSLATLNTAANEGLGLGLSDALAFDSTTSTAETTAAIVPGSTWSIEALLRADPVQVGTTWAIAVFQTAPVRLFFRRSAQFQLRIGANFYDGGPFPSLGVTHYLAVSRDGTSGSVTFYIDGSQTAFVPATSAGSLTGAVGLMRQPPQLNPFAGILQQLRVTAGTLSPAQVAATWNNARPLDFASLGPAAALWDCRRWTPNTLPDTSGNGFNLTTSNVAQVPGLYDLTLYPRALHRWGPGALVRATTFPLDPARPRTPHQTASLAWAS